MPISISNIVIAEMNKLVVDLSFAHEMTFGSALPEPAFLSSDNTLVSNKYTN
jgi:hypothetical protein